MASSAEMYEILGLGNNETKYSEMTKEKIMGLDKKSSLSGRNYSTKKPEGMPREIYNLLYNDRKNVPPLIPTDIISGKDHGYKQMKAKLGLRKVRNWKWVQFTNAARSDNLVLHHWRPAAEENTGVYQFVQFNKKLDILSYTDEEFKCHLQWPGWTRAETDHLMDLAQRFDLRFIIMSDRWDRDSFDTPRTIEDIKERYYGICDKLASIRGSSGDATGNGDKNNYVPVVATYDADHERLRKKQLETLYNRTPEQVEEEEMLKAELRRIDARKKERAKKTQDLQHLITQSHSTIPNHGVSNTGNSSNLTPRQKWSGASKKKVGSSTVGGGSSGSSTVTRGVIHATNNSAVSSAKDLMSAEGSTIKFADFKTFGVSTRSQRMKLPTSLGQRKTKAIDQLSVELSIPPPPIFPIPTESISVEFNALRCEMVLLYELKNALASYQAELNSMKTQYENLYPGKTLEIPDKLLSLNYLPKSSTPGCVRSISDVIDVGGSGGTPPNRKRKAALEQGNVLRKIKNKIF